MLRFSPFATFNPIVSSGWLSRQRFLAEAVEKPVLLRDVHATPLHPWSLAHESLDERLTGLGEAHAVTALLARPTRQLNASQIALAGRRYKRRLLQVQVRL